MVTFVVVLPYWLWSRSDPISQIPIPHASRDSYIDNLNAGLVFWVVPWGVLLPVLPYAIWKGLTTRIWPLALSLGLTTLLGTGGTTPLPKLLLRGAYDIITLDRFTFWATILILPFAGQFVLSFRHGGIATALRAQIGVRLWWATQVAFVLAAIAGAVLTTNLTHLRRFQPDQVEMQPIADFINKDEHWRWRYLALGFGDQMAWLAAQTTATTVDGDYHSARRLPELTTTPIERLEGAKYSGVPGIGSLQQFLTIPEKYNLKFIFSNDEFYDPILFFAGWHRTEQLQNGVVVWEREDVAPLPSALPNEEIPRYQRVMWGVLPMTAIGAALLVLTFGLWIGPLRRLRIVNAIDGKRRWQRRTALLPVIRQTDQNGVADIGMPQRASQVNQAIGSWLTRFTTWQETVGQRRIAASPSRVIRIVLVVLTLLLVASPIVAYAATRVRTPEEVLRAYYEDLDFRRFDDAYARLDPATRPSYDLYLLNLSVAGGLLASYAKLDAIETNEVSRESGYAVVEADASWITSLKRYDETQQFGLVKRGDRWYIEFDAPTEPIPQDEFFRRPSVSWSSQGRRALTTGKTDLADILDRPEIHVRSARLVHNGDLYSVVGEVINADVDPADITITAVVYDAAGNELTRYNAQSLILHKLLPKEMTPFRIDFEGVAGIGEGESNEAIGFEPGERFPVDSSIWTEAASFQVFAKAVATGNDLDRSVGAQDLVVSGDATNGYALNGTLLNTGAAEAIVPHVLVTYYDANGVVAWVDEVYLDASIRPERARAFSLSLPTATEIQTVIPTGQLFANGTLDEPATSNPSPLLTLPGDTGFSAVRLSVNYLTGAGS